MSEIICSIHKNVTYRLTILKIEITLNMHIEPTQSSFITYMYVILGLTNCWRAH